ncbi:MAG: subtilisin [Planctomycetota bacterium]|jgi:subtilisin
MLRLPLICATLCATVLAQQPGQVSVVISFKDQISQDVLAGFGIQATKTLFGAEAVTASVPASLVANLRRHGDIETVDLNHIASAYGPGNGGGGGPGGGGPGGGGGGSAPQTTPPGITRVGGSVSVTNVTVAILDTGIDLDHPDLQANIVGDVNFVKNGAGDDDNGHGSHCAGVVAAVDNTVGVVGITNASLLAVKVLDRRGSGSYADIVSGINWAASNGADIISMSLGGGASTASLQTACNNASSSILLVAAAGNDGDCDLNTNEINYPAYYSSVVSVGATSTDAASYDALMCFSSSNPDVELSAPGHNVNSCWKSGGYRVENGTSMACPHVAGCAAALWSGSPNNVLNTLINYSDDAGPAGHDNGWGHGVAEHVNT